MDLSLPRFVRRGMQQAAVPEVLPNRSEDHPAPGLWQHSSTRNGVRSGRNAPPSRRNGLPSNRNGRRSDRNGRRSTWNEVRSTRNEVHSTRNERRSAWNGRRSGWNGFGAAMGGPSARTPNGSGSPRSGITHATGIPGDLVICTREHVRVHHARRQTAVARRGRRPPTGQHQEHRADLPAEVGVARATSSGRRPRRAPARW
jgi:hypothetical protein